MAEAAGGEVQAGEGVHGGEAGAYEPGRVDDDRRPGGTPYAAFAYAFACAFAQALAGFQECGQRGAEAGHVGGLDHTGDAQNDRIRVIHMRQDPRHARNSSSGRARGPVVAVPCCAGPGYAMRSRTMGRAVKSVPAGAMSQAASRVFRA